MIDWKEIIKICSDLNAAQIKRAKGVLKYKGVPAGKVDSITDADDLADLLQSYFPSAELKNVIFEILEIINCENLIEKYRGILSDPSKQVNGGATSSTTQSATSSNTLEPVLLADTHLYPKLMRTQQQALVNGGTTSSTTGISATRSNTGVPVKAAEIDPKRLCAKCKFQVFYGTTPSTSEISATILNTAETLLNAIRDPIFCIHCKIKAWNRFHLLLAETAQGINGREVNHMKTILRIMKIYDPEANDTAIKIFRDLAKKEYISPTDQMLLIELLKGIERDDLVLLVKKYQDKYCIPQSPKLLEKTQSKKNLHQISNVQQNSWNWFQLLLAETAQEINGREVNQMKTILRVREIYEPEANDTAIKIFRDLAKKGYISPTDQTLLIELLRGIERDDLVLLVKKYQDKYCIPQSPKLLEKTQSKKNLHQISNVQQNCV